MKFITKLLLSLLSITALSSTAVSAKEASLKLDIYQADINSFHVSSVMVSGESEMVLIDSQFTLSDAHQVVAKILQSGKKLTTVYISHGDPDYYFGLEVIKSAFPNVEVYATEETVKYIKRSFESKMAFWGPKLGTNAPTNIIIPKVLKDDFLTVDGEKLKIMGLDKHPERTFVWIPAIKSVVGGVPVYGNVHLWIADAGTKLQRQDWNDILDAILALKPKTVIPGHATLDAPMTIESVQFTKNYLAFYEAALKDANDSKVLIQLINQKYPQASLPVALEIGAKVATGEMKW